MSGKDEFSPEYNETFHGMSQAILEILGMIGKQLLDEALTKSVENCSQRVRLLCK